jgi:flagellar basal body-associated protein FliL
MDQTTLILIIVVVVIVIAACVAGGCMLGPKNGMMGSSSFLTPDRSYYSRGEHSMPASKGEMGTEGSSEYFNQ